MSLKKIVILYLVVLIVGIVHRHARADVIITTDDMLLNGKILHKDQDKVMFANYYGTFNIKWIQIKKLFETESPEEDIKIYKSKRRNVNVQEVKRNYQVGLKKKMEKKGDAPFFMQLSLTPIYYMTLLDLKDTLPFSYSGALTMDVYKLFSLIPNMRIEADYQYLKQGDSLIHGPSLAIGPLFTTHNPRFNIQISPLFGGGYYFIESYNSQDEKFTSTKLSLNAKLIVGFSITFSKFVIMPQVRASYVHDGASPLLGLGGGLSFGVRL